MRIASVFLLGTCGFFLASSASAACVTTRMGESVVMQCDDGSTVTESRAGLGIMTQGYDASTGQSWERMSGRYNDLRYSDGDDSDGQTWGNVRMRSRNERYSLGADVYGDYWTTEMPDSRWGTERWRDRDRDRGWGRDRDGDWDRDRDGDWDRDRDHGWDRDRDRGWDRDRDRGWDRGGRYRRH